LRTNADAEIHLTQLWTDRAEQVGGAAGFESSCCGCCRNYLSLDGYFDGSGCCGGEIEVDSNQNY
jgi:hypothetical protein